MMPNQGQRLSPRSFGEWTHPSEQHIDSFMDDEQMQMQPKLPSPTNKLDKKSSHFQRQSQTKLSERASPVYKKAKASVKPIGEVISTLRQVGSSEYKPSAYQEILDRQPDMDHNFQNQPSHVRLGLQQRTQQISKRHISPRVDTGYQISKPNKSKAKYIVSADSKSQNFSVAPPKSVILSSQSNVQNTKYEFEFLFLDKSHEPTQYSQSRARKKFFEELNFRRLCQRIGVGMGSFRSKKHIQLSEYNRSFHNICQQEPLKVQEAGSSEPNLLQGVNSPVRLENKYMMSQTKNIIEQLRDEKSHHENLQRNLSRMFSQFSKSSHRQNDHQKDLVKTSANKFSLKNLQFQQQPLQRQDTKKIKQVIELRKLKVLKINSMQISPSKF